jgi:signal transduction histidine kinase
VIGIRTRQLGQLSFDQEQLLETFVNQIALVIERELLDEAAEQSLMHRESERLFAALLNSISHELRTPAARAWGCLSAAALWKHTAVPWWPAMRRVAAPALRSRYLGGPRRHPLRRLRCERRTGAAAAHSHRARCRISPGSRFLTMPLP